MKASLGSSIVVSSAFSLSPKSGPSEVFVRFCGIFQLRSLEDWSDI